MRTDLLKSGVSHADARRFMVDTTRLSMRVNSVLCYAAGLGLGTANTVRHRLQGYVHPRPFSTAESERVVRYSLGVVDQLEGHGARWEGRRVLEIGPGPDLATGAIMLHRGALAYHAVDLFDNRDEGTAAIYRSLERRLGAAVDVSRLGFTRTSFPALPDLSGEYDLIVSNACLEHVADPQGLFARLRELAAPGAAMIHQIDGKAHMRGFRDRDPLNHLRYSERLYRLLLDFPGAPNRVRGSQFAAMARAAGWADVTLRPDTRATDAYLRQARLAPPFATMPDRDVLTFTLTARADADVDAEH